MDLVVHQVFGNLWNWIAIDYNLGLAVHFDSEYCVELGY